MTGGRFVDRRDETTQQHFDSNLLNIFAHTHSHLVTAARSRFLTKWRNRQQQNKKKEKKTNNCNSNVLTPQDCVGLLAESVEEVLCVFTVHR